MKYRPEVDGLRTFAVLPVVLFHAGIGPFQGGFAGVDIFFVISGYLITSLIIKDLNAGTFSVLNFYERRARRILPALFVVLAVTSLFSWKLLYPLELNEFAQSAIATVLFSSNIFFWLKSDYFSTAAELKPLLHTWSLAVEEQFYLFFPPAMVLMWKSRNSLALAFKVLSVAAMLSLALLFATGMNWANAKFYLLPFRAWELLIGALCALAIAKWTLSESRALAAIGLGLVSVSLIYSTDANWPSWQTLGPTVGSALVILFASRDKGVGRLLSCRPLVACGLISYSLYLWHQPLLAFARLRLPDEPSDALKLLVICAAVILAALTWRFVEQPFRRKRNGRFVLGAKPMAEAMVASTVLVLAVGIATDISDGWASRSAPSGLTFRQIEDDLAGARIAAPPCDIDLAFRKPPSSPIPECIFAAEASPTKGHAILLGDSHATMLTDAIVARLTGLGFRTSVATFGGCVPFPGFRTATRNCDAANMAMAEHIAASRYDLIVLAYRPQPILNSEEPVYDKDGTTALRKPADEISAASIETLRHLLAADMRVVVIEPVPEMSRGIGHLARNRFAFDQNYMKLNFATPLATYEKRTGPYLAKLRALEGEGLHLIPTSDILCDAEQGRCNGIELGKALYVDDNHLSVFGVRKLMDGISDSQLVGQRVQ